MFLSICRAHVLGAAIFAVAIVGLITLTPSLAAARGGPLHLFGHRESHSVSRVEIPTPSISQDRAIGTCWRGRYRYLQTSRCRRPADSHEVTHPRARYPGQ
jgi:hypothetical protein